MKKVTDIVAEIAAASQEQSAGIEQVNKAVMQMDEVTQQNAALVEQASAAAASMDQEAGKLDAADEFLQARNGRSCDAVGGTGHGTGRREGVAAGTRASRRRAAVEQAAGARLRRQRWLRPPRRHGGRCPTPPAMVTGASSRARSGP